MGLKDDFVAAHAMTHHTDGSVELAKPFALAGQQQGITNDVTVDIKLDTPEIC